MVVFGSASDQDFAVAEGEGLRRAFIRYLDTVRIKPNDMHNHYNDWWTAPQPSSEAFVLANINELKKISTIKLDFSSIPMPNKEYNR